MKIRSVGKVKGVSNYPAESAKNKALEAFKLLGKHSPDVINTKVLKGRGKLSSKRSFYEADAEYKNMSVADAKNLIGDRADWELKAMNKALTSLRFLNTVEEEKRLSAVRVLLKERRLKK